MPGTSKIKYDPSLTLKQNAEKNQVSINAIKYYVKTRGIDREGDRQAQTIAKIKEARKTNPKASVSELMRMTGIGRFAITRYLPVVDGTGTLEAKRPRREPKSLVWEEGIQEPSKKGHLLMSKRLANLPELFQDADSQDVKPFHDFLFKDPGKPMLFIGNGGMLDHFAGLLYEMNCGVARCITPLELASMSDKTIKGCRCLLLSAGGGNMDIKYAAARLLKVNPENTACLTYNLGEAFKDFDPSRVFLFNTPGYEESFISVEDKFYRDALVYRAFTGNRASDIEIDSSCYQYRLNKSAATLTPLRKIKHFVVLFSDYAEPAAHDFESVLVETGVASAQVSDYRNYCHGRFLFVSNHTRHTTKKHSQTESDVAVVLFITPRNKGLVKDIRDKALASQTPVVIIETQYYDARAALDLLIKANVFLADYEEKGLGINPCDPDNYNAKDLDKRLPKNGVSFVLELTRSGQLQYVDKTKTDVEVQRLRAAISELEEIERRNTPNLLGNTGLFIRKPETLTQWEEYDASKHLYFAFRKKPDKRKGLYWIPFGNMNNGFDFDIKGIHFYNSEIAYICGMFSDNTPDQIAIQQQLVAETNGGTAKRDIRGNNQNKARKDWYDFNVQWMMYVVWQKVCKNEEFRELLLAVPEDAIIVEDSTFHKVNKTNDTAIFWGTRNQERKEYYNLVKKYVELTELSSTEAEQDRLITERFNNFTDYGVFKGCNVMGKILTLCRYCWKHKIEPPIDYKLLRSKNIYLLGQLLTFGETPVEAPMPIQAPKKMNINPFLLGTIAGDMIGKPYERHKNSIKTTDFPLFSKTCKYTDDSVLTIAVMDWLMADKDLTWDYLADRFVHYGTRYRFKYQDRCFSNGFTAWLKDEKRPFGRVSSSNGAAMRVSPVGWFFSTLEEVENAAKIQASLTHNHPIAIQGAKAAAVAVFLARTGKSKEEIKEFMSSRYGFDLSQSMEKYRAEYEWTSDCMKTVEGALMSFLLSDDFEGAVRNAVALGGDADTIGAITGSIAEAYYGGLPEPIKKEVLRRSIPDEFKDILSRFSRRVF